MEQLEKTLLPQSEKTEKKFFFFFLWTSLVPLILLFLAGYYTTANLLQKQAFEKHTAMAEQKHGELALFVEKVQEITAAWGTDGRIRELTQKINDGPCSNANVSEYCAVNKELSDYLLKYKIPLDPAVGIIDILNTNGIIVASSDPLRIGINEGIQKVPIEEAKVLQFGQATFLHELVSETEEFDGRLMIHLMTPIASTDNKRLVGLLLAHTESNRMNAVIAENKGETTESYLVNKDKLMMTPSRFLQDVVMKKEVNTPPVQACTARGIPFKGAYKDYRGVEVFGASICDPNLFGTLIVETDRSEVFIEINRLRNTASAILVVVLILILGYAYFLGTDIIRGARHIFPSTFSSAVTLGIVISIIVLATLGISFVFTQNIEKFIVNQKINIITSLVSQQAERHINHANISAFETWESPSSQQKFIDFSEEILNSFYSVSAIQLHTPEGVLVWSSLQNAKIGTMPESNEVLQALRTGEIVMKASTSTVLELGISTLVEIYVPILDKDGEIAGTAETYINTGDILIFTQNIQRVLWVGAFIAIVLIFIILRFVFRRQDARIIAQSEELSSLIAQSPVGLYTIDRTGIITSVNPKMLELFVENDSTKILGRNIFDVKRIQRMGISQEIKEALLGKSFKKDINVKDENGNLLYRYYQGAPLFGENKVTVERVLFIVEDITEKKKLEEEIRGYTKGLEEKITERTKDIVESKAKAEALLASLGEGMIATDTEGRVIAMNRMAEKMLGWHESEIIGKKTTEIVPAVDENGNIVPPEKRICLIVVKEGNTETMVGTIYLIRKDGEKVPVSETATPVIINGRTTGAVIIFRDITAENEIEKTRRDLLSLASHQLRTPLSGTKWLIETLKKGIHGTLTKNQEEYLDQIYKINEQMTTLVHDMLSVLRMEGDITPSKKVRVSLTSILEGLRGTLGSAAKSKHISLRLENDAEYVIETDPLLLQNILENIVSNAINYSGNETEVVVSVYKKDSEIIFSVKDSGIGIPREEQRQVFERFYRASNAKTFDTHGTGLGLYIATTFAKKIGARLSFESSEGKGSTFYIHLPLHQ